MISRSALSGGVDPVVDVRASAKSTRAPVREWRGTLSSCVANPARLASSTSEPGGTSSANRPCRSATAVRRPPWAATRAPGNGFPFTSWTNPFVCPRPGAGNGPWAGVRRSAASPSAPGLNSHSTAAKAIPATTTRAIPAKRVHGRVSAALTGSVRRPSLGAVAVSVGVVLAHGVHHDAQCRSADRLELLPEAAERGPRGVTEPADDDHAAHVREQRDGVRDGHERSRVDHDQVVMLLELLDHRPERVPVERIRRLHAARPGEDDVDDPRGEGAVVAAAHRDALYDVLERRLPRQHV